MQRFQLTVLKEAEALVDFTLHLWKVWSEAAIAERGSFRVALAGGSTPKQLYTKLAQMPELNWRQTILAWGDERYVPADHADSNYRMTRMALLDHIDCPSDNILAWPTSAGDPAQDAQTYGETLKAKLGSPTPVFDLVLLGVGPDGHTASLFPGTPALEVVDQPTTVGSKDGDPRLTLTYPVINASRQVAFLVSGAGKAEIMAELLKPGSPVFPAQRVQPQGSLLWLLDQDAAGGISIKTGL